MTIRYMSGVTSDEYEVAGLSDRCDLLVQPRSGYYHRVRRFERWGGDNGAFGAAGFSATHFRAMLASQDLRDAAATCRFVAAPDVLVRVSGDVRGDAAATLAQFPPWADEIREAGFPVALVAQDGLERMLEQVPWLDIDTLFIGGSTEWKLGAGAAACVAAARARGVPVHFGRVNSFRWLAYADRLGCVSADGTFLKYGGIHNLARLFQWLDRLAPAHVYLAGAIYQTDNAAQSWRAGVAAALRAHRIAVADPIARDYRGRETENAGAIVRDDLAEIDRAACVLALADAPSWGTAMEIRHAFVRGVPVVAACAQPPSPWLTFHAEVVSTIAEAVRVVVGRYGCGRLLCRLLDRCECE